jgi:hypothetical protein
MDNVKFVRPDEGRAPQTPVFKELPADGFVSRPQPANDGEPGTNSANRTAVQHHRQTWPEQSAKPEKSADFSAVSAVPQAD